MNELTLIKWLALGASYLSIAIILIIRGIMGVRRSQKQSDDIANIDKTTKLKFSAITERWDTVIEQYAEKFEDVEKERRKMETKFNLDVQKIEAALLRTDANNRDQHGVLFQNQKDMVAEMTKVVSEISDLNGYLRGKSENKTVK